MYCAHCGNPLPEAEGPAEDVTIVEAPEVNSAEVEIAKINADRDIRIARIGAGVVESEAVVELAHAEGVAEGLETAVAPPEPPPAEPVVVVDNNDEEPEPSIPPAEPEEHHERKPAKKSGFFS